jgi:hypothetical protein
MRNGARREASSSELMGGLRTVLVAREKRKRKKKQIPSDKVGTFGRSARDDTISR